MKKVSEFFGLKYDIKFGGWVFWRIRNIMYFLLNIIYFYVKIFNVLRLDIIEIFVIMLNMINIVLFLRLGMYM